LPLFAQMTSQVMNLFLKSYNKCLIFFLFITIHVPVISSIWTDSALFFSPRIQPVVTPLQQDNLPYISFYCDNKGVLYLGKENELIIISGEKVSRHHLHGPVYVTGNINDSVYYACNNDFGAVSREAESRFSIHSLIPEKDLSSNLYPVSLHSSGKEMFIQTEREIIAYSEGNFSGIPFNNSISGVFKGNKTLFAITQSNDLFSWEAGAFRKLPITFPFSSKEITRLGFKGDTLSAVTEEGKEYRYLQGEASYELYSVKRISPPGLIAINASCDILKYRIIEGKGLIMASQGQHMKFFLGSDKGYTFTDLISSHCDQNSNLWLLFSYGVYKVDNPELFSLLDLQRKYKGRINTMLTSGEKIYLAGNSGIACIYLSQPVPQLKQLKPAEKENLYLLGSSRDHFFTAGNKHLYEITADKLVGIDTGLFYRMLVLSPDSLLLSGKEGLSLYTRDETNGIWTAILLDPSFHSVYSLCRFEHSIWFVTGENEVIRIKDNPSGALPEKVFTSIKPVSLHLINNNLLLFTGDTVIRISGDGVKNEVLKHQEELSWILQSQNWINENDSLSWTISNRKEKPALWSLGYNDRQLSASVYPLVPEINEITGMGSTDDCLWISDREKLYRINRFSLPDNFSYRSSLLILNENNEFTYLEKDSGKAPKDKVSEKQVKFSFLHRNFSVSFPPEANLAGNNYFIRYRLLPTENKWGEWTSQKAIEIQNLKPGKYNLEIERINQFGQLSPKQNLPFTIRIPFFRHWITFIFYGILLFILIVLINKWRLFSIHQIESKAEEKVQDQIKELVREKEKSDKLVADMFPKTTAEELKTSGRAKWDKYDMATVLFSDIQGFTKIAEHMNPEVLIDELDKFFFHFDSVVDKYNIEKIKTIGDAYMAAGGIPEKNSTNPVEVVLAALEMQRYMLELKKTNSDIWDLRIGIHTGPVIAGVVGHKKLSYDIWGDTVNTASRMESSGIAGKVNISGTTYSLVKDYFICEYRGKLPVKYKGNIDMYFVVGLRPELTVDLAGLPNKRFNILLQTLRINDLEEKVYEDYYNTFDSRFTYHTSVYIRKFVDQVRLLCRAEELDEEDTLMCLSAAILLYSGLSQAYENFENRSAVISRDLLPLFRYSDKQIDLITNIILGTKLPFEPRNTLEKILIDARMEYLGRPDLPELLLLKYEEANNNGNTLDYSSWKEKELILLKNFKFYTPASRRLREIQGEDQISKLQNNI